MNTIVTAASPFAELESATRREREALFEIPFVRRAMAGDVSLESYRAFLANAYHHVKHTVPLLMAAGAALGQKHRWLLDAFCEYVEEERGHDEWILADIAASGGDAAAVRRSEPEFACELLVSYAYDVIGRGNPLGFLGMVHVLEGTSVRAASRAAEALGRSLALPPGAFTYLTTHGELDREHTAFFENLVNRIHDPADRAWIAHCARNFYELYGNVLRSVPLDAPSESNRESNLETLR